MPLSARLNDLLDRLQTIDDTVDEDLDYPWSDVFAVEYRDLQRTVKEQPEDPAVETRAHELLEWAVKTLPDIGRDELAQSVRLESRGRGR